MALATQCPHCHTTFRVASDQLKLRGGIVRCGACQSIFDGSAHLIDLDALAASKAQAAQPDAAPAGDAPDTAPADATPVYTLDFDHTLDPLGILPEAPAPVAAPDGELADELADDIADELPDDTTHVTVDEPAGDAEPIPAADYAYADRIEPSFDLPVDEELVAQPLPDEDEYPHETEHAHAGQD
ncbi:MAG: zinc-ribbon domain-containing protein, partial [Telluria sp.]